MTHFLFATTLATPQLTVLIGSPTHCIDCRHELECGRLEELFFKMIIMKGGAFLFGSGKEEHVAIVLYFCVPVRDDQACLWSPW